MIGLDSIYDGHVTRDFHSHRYGIACALTALAVATGWSKAAAPELPPLSLAADQLGRCPRGFASVARGLRTPIGICRGSRTVNVVPSPTLVAHSIVPP